MKIKGSTFPGNLSYIGSFSPERRIVLMTKLDLSLTPPKDLQRSVGRWSSSRVNLYLNSEWYAHIFPWRKSELNSGAIFRAAFRTSNPADFSSYASADPSETD